MIAPIACAPAPLVSVVVPTYQRPELLRRALLSICSQTFQDYEVIVSDDDCVNTETKQIVRGVFGDDLIRDGVVRLIINEDEHGQVGNVNHAMRAARGKWIKPLFDDDVLKPLALQQMVRAAERCPRSAIVRCLTDRVIDGRNRGAERIGRRSAVELIRQRDVHLAMYLQDLDIGTPTSVLVHRRVIDASVLFEEPEGISSSVDGWWFIRALRHGDLTLCNEPLVEMHQGGHDTVTSETNDEARYAQFELLREWLLPMIDLDHTPPPIESAQGMIRLIRAACDAAHGHPWRAVRRALAEHDAGAWRLAGQWALRRALPGHAEAIPRISIRIPDDSIPVQTSQIAPTVPDRRAPAHRHDPAFA